MDTHVLFRDMQAAGRSRPFPPREELGPTGGLLGLPHIT